MSKDDLSKKDLADFAKIFASRYKVRESGLRGLRGAQFDPVETILSFLPAEHGSIPIGINGYRAMKRMAIRWRKESASCEDIDVSSLINLLRSKFLPIWKEESEHDEQEFCTRLKREVLQAEFVLHEELIHHFPCTFVSALRPEALSLGPVSLVRREAFFSSNNEKITNARCRSERSSSLISGFVDQADQYGWIGSVNVPKCAAAVSRKRAELALHVALAAFRVPWVAGRKAGMYAHHERHNVSGSYSLVEKCDGSWEGTGHYSWPDVSAEDEWITEDNAFFSYVAPIIDACVRPRTDPFTQRLIDAHLWFSEALVETLPGLRIVRFVGGMERLVPILDIKGVSERSAEMTARLELLCATNERSARVAREQVITVRKQRNKILHGYVSPALDEHWPLAKRARDLCADAIVNATIGRRALAESGKDLNDEQLEAAFRRMRHDADATHS